MKPEKVTAVSSGLIALSTILGMGAAILYYASQAGLKESDIYYLGTIYILLCFLIYRKLKEATYEWD